ncbi:MAG: hypothetical protein IPK53_10820 [bacterium]|nr:hypothetical protein [bacterium]
MVENYAYIADGPGGGLRIVNVSDPTAPAEAGFYDTPGSARGVAVAGNYAYVADGVVRIVDVSDPTAPTGAGFYYPPSYALGVAVVGSYVYVAPAEAGLRVVDVSNPAAPTEVGFYDMPDGYAGRRRYRKLRLHRR